jgi:hypothetical protein
MADFLNLPTGDDMRRVADAMERIAAKEETQVTDYTDAPGAKVLVGGNRTNGFYGFVQPHEFGEIAANPVGRKEMNGANLALAIGLTGGTAINSDTAWMKFSRNGEIYLVPVKPIRHSTTWNQIYAAGAVYGDGTVGMTPPNGRAGNRLSVSGETNAYLIDNPGDGFLRASAVFGKVGDKLVARGFVNAANNGEFTITAITDDAITVDGDLVDEASTSKASIYEKTQAVNQNRDVVIGGNRYRVQLLKGASQDPLDSYSDADRDMVGPNSEWNHLILPMHEKAKLQNWAYKSYAGETEDWGIGLTDADLITHHTFGAGNYTWCQETNDNESYLRVIRGGGGASRAVHNPSWFVYSHYGFRPALRLLS